LQGYLEEARKDRADRIRARRDAVRAKWGDLALRPAFRNELRLHAWRVARLRAIRQIALDESNPELAARCDALLAREERRHDRRMAALKVDPAANASGAAATGTASAGSAASAAAPNPEPEHS
jgi:hypothetical protein